MTALVLAALLSVGTSQARPGVDYVIGAGDVLTVNVFGQDAHSGDVVVRPDGKVSRLLIGEMLVAGLTMTEFRDALKPIARTSGWSGSIRTAESTSSSSTTPSSSNRKAPAKSRS